MTNAESKQADSTTVYPTAEERTAEVVALRDRVRVLEGHRNQWRRIASRLQDAVKDAIEGLDSVPEDAKRFARIAGVTIPLVRGGLKMALKASLNGSEENPLGLVFPSREAKQRNEGVMRAARLMAPPDETKGDTMIQETNGIDSAARIDELPPAAGSVAQSVELRTFNPKAKPRGLAGWDDAPLPEDDAIKAAHPSRSGRHDMYAEAMRLVGARRSKAGLVELVTWLLLRAEGKCQACGRSFRDCGASCSSDCDGGT